LTASGAPDPTFADGGSIGFASGADNSKAPNLALDPSGNLVLPGSASQLSVRRLTPAGAFDTSFGGNGVAQTGLTYDTAGLLRFGSFAVQSDARVVIAGELGGGNDFAMVRVQGDGGLDKAFGDGGTAALGNSTYAPSSVAIGAGGAILACTPSGVTRFTAAGAADATFGTGGTVSTSLFAQSVAGAADGSVFVAGIDQGKSTAVVAHLTSAGAFDAAFGTSGKTAFDLGASNDHVRALALQSDGKILAAGVSTGVQAGAALARYTSAGALDTTFGTNGKITAPVGGHAAIAPSGLAVDASGRAVMSGTSIGKCSIARFDIGGVPDASFGTGGQLDFQLSGAAAGSVCNAMATDAQGRFVMAGVDANAAFGLARVTSVGALDATFGTGGVVSTSIDVGSKAYALAIQSDGKIVAAGYAIGAMNDGAAIARYTDTGALDTTFGNAGIAFSTVSQGSFAMRAVAFAVAIQSDGKIVIAGTLGEEGDPNDIWGLSTPTKLFVARLLPGGAPDTSFGAAGVLAADLGATTVYGQAIALLPDGHIFVAGELLDGTTKRGFMARVTSSGALDSSFGTNGVALVSVGNASGLRALALQPDGKLVAAGEVFVSPTGNDFALLRLQ
jgi:uncharacterized delta-60 repeat protein